MCPYTIVHHLHLMVAEVMVDYPNYFHHFLKLSRLRNVALDLLDFGDHHQIYVYRLLKIIACAQEKMKKKKNTIEINKLN